MPDFRPRTRPRRIFIRQEGLGVHNAGVYDADTGQQLDAVFEIVLHRGRSTVVVTVSAFTPNMPSACGHDLARELGVNPEDVLDYRGVVCVRVEYPVADLRLEAGAPK